MFGYIMLSPLAIGFTVNRAKALHHARPPDAMPPSFARYALEDITANHVLDADEDISGLEHIPQRIRR